MTALTFTVQQSGERLDALLARSVEGLTRSAAQRLLEDEAVTPRTSLWTWCTRTGM